jgi:hypothetical protein
MRICKELCLIKETDGLIFCSNTVLIKTYKRYVGHEVPTAVVIQVNISRDTAPCSPSMNWSFEERIPCLQSRKSAKQETSLLARDGDDTFLRHVSSYNTALHLRRRYFLETIHCWYKIKKARTADREAFELSNKWSIHLKNCSRKLLKCSRQVVKVNKLRRKKWTGNVIQQHWAKTWQKTSH